MEDLDGTLRTLVRYLQTRLQIPASRVPEPSTVSAQEFARTDVSLAADSWGRGWDKLPQAPGQGGGVREAIKAARDYLAGRPEDPALLGLSWGRLH